MSKNQLLQHQPILVPEILKLLPAWPMDKKQKWILDATFGRGGHTQAFLRHLDSSIVIALDKDITAVNWGIKNLKPQFSNSLHILHADFHHYSDLMKNIFPAFMKNPGFDIVIMDLGSSSPQLDDPKRGFGFYKDGPLDMRMNPSQEFSAMDIVNQWGEERLKNLFYSYGEVYRSGRVVKGIMEERKVKPLTTTRQLADLIQKKTGWKKKGRHPATPYFLALRIAVNNELEGLGEALPKMINSLNTGGRIFILSFHSLEDRIVKNIFKAQHKKSGVIINKKVIRPDRKEIDNNPRARSAMLRVFEKKVIIKS